MKTLRMNLVKAAILMLPFGLLQAQEKTTQAYWVHEDVVKPGMVIDYENICKELTSNLKKHNIQEVNSLVVNTADNRYLWVGPIENMAQLDKPLFTTLAEKMGADNMGALFNKMDKCYDIEQNYIIHLDKELSYMPGGITQTPEGQDYRKFHYYHYSPDNREAIKEKAQAVKKLFESRGSQLYYRVYRSGFGNRGEYYMVAIAAKDAADYANKVAANNELLGEEWEKTYTEFMGTVSNFEPIEGRMRPDMAYTPQ